MSGINFTILTTMNNENDECRYVILLKADN